VFLSHRTSQFQPSFRPANRAIYKLNKSKRIGCSSAAGGVLPRRVLAAVAIHVLVLAGEVPLDLALVDQAVVVLPFPDDPDTPGKGDAGPACA